MLQQTQVATVIPYFHRFMERFPTVKALAEAPEATVLTAWSGLGYYSRAKNLHRGAKYLLENHDGKFPKTREEILLVPGIGPYTAGAILSIAFDLKEPLVDGNVQRVFSRFFGFQEEIESPTAQKFFWKQAADWVEASTAPRVLNQALMELGATLCTKGKPRCALCPLRKNCVAFEKGWQERLPLRRERRKSIELWWVSLILETQEKIFLKQNPKGEWWSDLWDFPHVPVKGPRDHKAKAVEFADALPIESFEELDHQKHTVTHHKLHVAPYRFRMKKGKTLPSKEWKGGWFTRQEIEQLPLSSLARKLLQSHRPLFDKIKT